MKRFVFFAVFCFSLISVSLNAQSVADFEIVGNDDGTMTIVNYRGSLREIVIVYSS